MSALCVLALGLGIGASAAVWSAVQAVLIDSIAVDRPDRVYLLWETNPARGEPEVELSYPNFESWRDRAGVFSSVAALPSVNFDARLSGREPIQVEATAVSGSFFSLLGARPALGRTLTPADDKPGAPPAIVISDSLWRRRFGGDPAAIGQTLTVDGTVATVVGVMPAAFGFPRGAELWAAIANDKQDWMNDRSFRVLRAVGRLTDGVDERTAQASMDRLAAALSAEFPKENGGHGARLVRLSDAIFGKARTALWMVLGAVGVLLLVACANVANLLLARALSRRRELGIRLALGASRGELVRQLLVEGALLAVAGGVLGLLLAHAGLDALISLAPQEIPRIRSAHLDARALGFTAFATVASALLSSLFPALAASRVDLHESLQQGSQAPRGRRLRTALVVAEVALSVVLVGGAGLLVRSYGKLASIDPGFRADNVLTARLALDQAKVPDKPRRAAFYARVLEKARALPGVTSAAAILMRPLSGTIGWDYPFEVEGQDAQTSAQNPYSNFQAVSPGAFQTLGIVLQKGRDFADTEAGPVVIVGESVARHFWPGQDPLGKRLRFGRAQDKSPWRTVVGVVRDARYREWDALRPDLYAPISQEAQFRTDLLLKTSVPPLTLAPALRRAVLEVDSDQPLAEVGTLSAAVEGALARPRFNALLLAVFAGVSLLLAAIGVYGVMAWSVAQRTRELGVRMALGATPSRLLRQVLVSGLSLALVGCALGLAAAVGAGRLLRSQLFEVSAADPKTLLVTAAALALTALVASLVPALRATRVDPAESLRAE